MNLRQFHFAVVLAAGFLITPVASEEQAPSFVRDVRPILSNHCFACHGPDAIARKAKLRFDTATGIRAAKKVIAEELIDRVTSEIDETVMPPPAAHKPLNRSQIAILTRWVKSGAKYEAHWAYEPLKRPPVPRVKNTDWPANDIDRFLLAKMEAAGVSPSPDADRNTIARRLRFDLHGLPPSAAESQRFRISTLSAQVDRLLKSPRYGERMAVFWLDLVRYADTVGYHGDQDHRSQMYRDYVIKAFWKNYRFDRFTREQLAGDLLKNRTEEQLIASGYNRLLQTSHEGGVQKKEYLAKYSADRVRNLGQVWLGSTTGCAECHDHKYDPITQKDFYRLAAVFADVDDIQTFRAGNSIPTQRRPEIDVKPLFVDEERVAALRKRLAQAKSKSGNKAEIAAIEKQIAALTAKVRTMVTGSVKPRVIRIFPRGDWLDESGEIVQAGTPAFLKQPAGKGPVSRLDLANWICSQDNPLTARVFVNRLWALFFGRGLSTSLEDVGNQGQPPTHPALLDWLAVEFIESGWDVQHMVKLIVTSRAYRQSSRVRKNSFDSRNALFTRQNRWRLPAEFVRDNALEVSGLLVKKLGGPRSRPYQPVDYYKPLNFPRRRYRSDSDENQYRRGVYMHWQRQYLHPMLRAFDAPTREESCARRAISNTPLAALTLLNDPTFIEAARALGERAMKQTTDPTTTIRWMWQQVLSRQPNRRELATLSAFQARQLRHFRKNSDAAGKLLAVGLQKVDAKIDRVQLATWTSVARALLNLHEAVTRE